MLIDTHNIMSLKKLPAVTVICEVSREDIMKIRSTLINLTVHCSHAYIGTKEAIDSNNWQIKNFNYESLEEDDDLGYLSIIDCRLGNEKEDFEIIRAVGKSIKLGFKNYYRGVQILLLYRGTKDDFIEYYKPEFELVYGSYKDFKFELEDYSLESRGYSNEKSKKHKKKKCV